MARAEREAGAARSGRGADLIGRERELAELLETLDLVAERRGGLVVVAGEAGIGKTRVVRELTEIAAGEGANCVWSYCGDIDGAPPFWPWVQIVRGTLSTPAGATALAALGPARDDLGTLVPEARATGATRPATCALGPGDARLPMFEAVRRYLAGIAAPAPLLVLLDDVHVADEPSLHLLRFLARRLPELAVMIVATARDGSPADRRNGLLADVIRHGTCLPLAGLSADEVGRLMLRVSGREPSAAAVADLHSRTGGNPFFVQELARHPPPEAPASHLAEVCNGVPASVRAAVARRVQALPVRCRAAVATASAVGSEFDLDVVARAVGIEPPSLLDTLAEAVADRIVRESPSRPARLSFSHDIIREAVYDDLGPGGRAEVHARIAVALEALSGDDPEAPIGALAHHFFHAIPVLGSERALAYTMRSAELAQEGLGYEEALAQYQRARQLLGGSADRDEQRFEVLVAMGDVQSKIGDIPGARSSFGDASLLARRMCRPDLLGRAALGFGGRFVSLARRRSVDESLVALLEEALAAAGPRETILRATLTARLARSLYFSDRAQYKRNLCDEALLAARELDDTDALAAAFHAQFWTYFEPEHSDTRLAAADEIVRLAARRDDRELELQGRQLRLIELGERGLDHEGDRELEAYAALAASLRQPVYLWYAQAMRAGRALRRGDFIGGERQARIAAAAAVEIDMPIARPAYVASLFWPCLEQGRLRELADDIEGAARQCGCPLCRAAGGVLAAEEGRFDDAGRVYGSLVDARLVDLPANSTRFPLLASLAHLCVVLVDHEGAGLLFEALLPYRGRVAAATPCATYGGRASFHLGRLASLQGRLPEAAQLLRSAMEEDASGAGRARLARTKCELARVLSQARSSIPIGAFDGAGVARLVDDADATAQALGMAVLAADCAELQGGAADRPVPVAGRVRQPVDRPVNLFKREGDFWVVRYNGVGVTLRDSKGLAYLAILLRDPGREHHVAELSSRWLPALPSTSSPTLDAAAVKSYKRRLVDIDEDLQEAERCNDIERAAALAAEADSLTSQLVSAFGLNGRARDLDDQRERIRKAVTARIRSSIRKTADQHETLGAHLANSVRTGTFCSYSPESPVSWIL